MVFERKLLVVHGGSVGMSPPDGLLHRSNLAAAACHNLDFRAEFPPAAGFVFIYHNRVTGASTRSAPSFSFSGHQVKPTFRSHACALTRAADQINTYTSKTPDSSLRDRGYKNAQTTEEKKEDKNYNNYVGIGTTQPTPPPSQSLEQNKRRSSMICDVQALRPL